MDSKFTLEPERVKMSQISDKSGPLTPVEMPADRDAAKGDARASRLVLKKTSEEVIS
jgi:hypothetical protein